MDLLWIVASARSDHDWFCKYLRLRWASGLRGDHLRRVLRPMPAMRHCPSPGRSGCLAVFGRRKAKWWIPSPGLGPFPVHGFSLPPLVGHTPPCGSQRRLPRGDLRAHRKVFDHVPEAGL